MSDLSLNFEYDIDDLHGYTVAELREALARLPDTARIRVDSALERSGYINGEPEYRIFWVIEETNQGE